MQTTKQVTTPAECTTPHQLPSEKKLKSRQRLSSAAAITMLLFGIALVIVGTLQFSGTQLSFFSATRFVWMSCYLGALILAAGVWLAAKYARKQTRLHHYYYEEVRKGLFQGIVVGDNRKNSSLIAVIIRGENRAKQQRAYKANMLAEKFHGKPRRFGETLVVRNGLAE